MSPKRKKVETALKNLFSNKNPAEGEASASTQPEKEPEIKSTELLEETNPEPPKPKTRRTTKKETVPQSEKTEQPEPVKEETTVLKTETKIAVRPETNLEAPMVKQSVEEAVQPPQQEIKTSPVPEVTGSAAPDKITTKPVKKEPPAVQVTQIEQEVSTVETKVSQEEIQLVIFELDHEYYGVDIALVESIIKMQHYTVVPHTPDYLVGVTNLRGYVLPVVDLRKRFNLPDQVETTNTRIMVLMLNSEKVGMIVDGVSEVARVFANDIDPTPKLVTSINMDFIKGIAKLHTEDEKEVRMAILLEMEKVLKTK